MTTTPSARAREAAKVLTDYLAIGLKDGETERAFARFESAIRADQMKRDAGVAEKHDEWSQRYGLYANQSIADRTAEEIAAAILAQMENSDAG
ncbi:hypothetical protein [Sphingobium abikonense]|uniref:hypothetical protein n=1 Tax=Sphingobium abikonense TaxID=86193 RepID=UPI003517E019